jgi:hypothetical protein
MVGRPDLEASWQLLPIWHFADQVGFAAYRRIRESLDMRIGHGLQKRFALKVRLSHGSDRIAVEPVDSGLCHKRPSAYPRPPCVPGEQPPIAAGTYGITEITDIVASPRSVARKVQSRPGRCAGQPGPAFPCQVCYTGLCIFGSDPPYWRRNA